MSFTKLIESSSDARLQSSGAELNLSEGFERSIIREDTAKKSGAAAIGDFVSNQYIKQTEEKLSIEDLNKEYGVPNALIFDKPEYPSVAKRKRENKISDLTRQSILAAESFDNKFVQKGSLIAHSLGIGIVTDPFTIASAGVGAVGLVGKGAGVLAKTAGLSKQYQNTMAMYNAVADSKYVQFVPQAFDRAVNPVFNRIANGNKVVASGLRTMAAANVENLIVEPFVYTQAKENGYNYDLLQSAAIQLSFSGVAGVAGAGITAWSRNSKFKNLTETNAAFKKQTRQMYNYSKLDPNFPDRVVETADVMSKKYGVNLDKVLIEAVIQQESGFDPNAKSGVGAQGLMQLMPGTAKDLGVVDVFNAAENLRGGAEYLAQQLKTFKGDKAKALAAYNWGPGNVQKAIRNYGDSWLSHAPDETKDYVRRITKDFNEKKKFTDASAFLGKVTTNTDDFSTNVARASAYLDNSVRNGKISKQAYTELTLKAMDDAYADNAIDLDYVYATLKADQNYNAKTTFFNDLESGRYDAYVDDAQKIKMASNPDIDNIREYRFKSWVGENIGLTKMSKALDDIDASFNQLKIKTRTLKSVELKAKALQDELIEAQRDFTRTQKTIERAATSQNIKGLDNLQKKNIELQNRIARIESDLSVSNSLRNQVTDFEVSDYYKQALQNDPAKLDFETFRTEFKNLQASLKAKKNPDVKTFANMSKETKAELARLYHLSNFDDIDNLSTKALVDLDDVDIETAYLDHKFKQELDKFTDANVRETYRKNIDNPYYKQDRNADDLLIERDSDYFENDFIDETEVKALEAEIKARAGLQQGLKQFDDEIKALEDEIKFLERDLGPALAKVIKGSENRRVGFLNTDALLKELPPIEENMTRLYRGHSDSQSFNDVFDSSKLTEFKDDAKGVFYTDDIKTADYYRHAYNKNNDAKISYIDIPTRDLDRYKATDGYKIPIESDSNIKTDFKIDRSFDGSNEGAIAQILLQSRIKKSSLQEMAKSTDGAKAFISVKGGRSLDDLATEMSELSGKEVSPDEIVDFVTKYSSAKDYFQKRGDQINTEAPRLTVAELKQELDALKEAKASMQAEKQKFATEQEARYKTILDEFEVYKRTLDEEEALAKVELEFAKCLRGL